MLKLSTFATSMASNLPEKCSVKFEEIQPTYGPDDNIFVVYTIGSSVKPTSRDWVGLYRTDWTSPQQYLAFEWAPKRPRDSNFPLIRSVLFRANYIHVPPSPDNRYQFMYVTKNDTVLSSSTSFRIFDENQVSSSSDDDSLECVQCPNSESLTLIRSNPQKHKGLLNTFELIQDHPEANVLEVETHMKRMITDQNSLVGSYSSKVEQLDILKIIEVLDKEEQAENEEQTHPKQKMIESVTERETGEMKRGAPTYAEALDVKRKTSEKRKEATDADNDLKDSDSDVSSCRSLVPVYNAVVQSQVQSPTLRPMPFFFPTSTGIRHQSSRCCKCKTRQTRYRQMQHKLLAAKMESHTLRNDMRDVQQTLSMKEAVLDELSVQIKSLIRENTTLTNANNTLAESAKASAHNLQTEKLRNDRDLDTLQSTLETLMAHSDSMAAEKELTEHELKAERRKIKQLNADNSDLCRELCKTRCRVCELEEYLDDILYTLSLHGYTALINTSGEEIDLTKKSGQVMQLQGNSATSCEQEEHDKTLELQAQMLSDYRRSCAELTEQVTQWKSTVTGKDKKLAEIQLQLDNDGEKMIRIEAEVANLENSLRQASEREEFSRREVLEIKKEKSRLLRAHGDKERNLRMRIKSLQDSLRAMRITAPATPGKGGKVVHVNTDTKKVTVHYDRDPISVSPVPDSTTDAAPTVVRKKSSSKQNPRQATPGPQKSTHKKSKHSKHTQQTNYGVPPRQETQGPESFFAQFGQSGRQDNASAPPCGSTCTDVEEQMISSVVKGPKKTTTTTTTTAKQVSSHVTADTCRQRTLVGAERTEETPRSGGASRSGGKSSKASKKSPGHAVQIVDGVCSRCGLVFPPDSTTTRVEKHRSMHHQFGY